MMRRVPRIVVSLHDLHPGSQVQVRRQHADLRGLGVQSLSHLVVPEFHHQSETFQDAALCDWLGEVQNQGDELILHGYYHDRQGQSESLTDLFWTRFYTNQEAEFYSLSEPESIDRWKRGRALFEGRGWKTPGFIAPAWLLNSSLIQPLQGLGFDYSVVYEGIWDLSQSPKKEIHPIPTLCWSSRSWWRRQVSLVWNGFRFQTFLSKGIDFRVSLHPGDVDYPLIWNQIMTMVRQAIRAGYQPVTYGTYHRERWSASDFKGMKE
jgi:predicted deacetylase